MKDSTVMIIMGITWVMFMGSVWLVDSVFRYLLG